jgi:uncharacterized damage-inducible protein DinB
MTRILVDQLVKFLDDAFEGSRIHSIIGNLESVTEDDWSWAIEGEEHRSIRDIAMHLASAKQVYNSHAFGDGSLHWPQAHELIEINGGTLASGVAWLREGHALLRDNLSALNDDDLLTQRNVHWGATLDTSSIIQIMIQHDIYHAGEINHLRAIRQGTDHWPRRG